MLALAGTVAREGPVARNAAREQPPKLVTFTILYTKNNERGYR